MNRLQTSKYSSAATWVRLQHAMGTSPCVVSFRTVAICCNKSDVGIKAFYVTLQGLYVILVQWSTKDEIQFSEAPQDVT